MSSTRFYNHSLNSFNNHLLSVHYVNNIGPVTKYVTPVCHLGISVFSCIHQKNNSIYLKAAGGYTKIF